MAAPMIGGTKRIMIFFWSEGVKTSYLNGRTGI